MDATTLSLEEINQKIHADIQSYGWSIILSVYQGSTYANTIGLETNFDHPEIEILGLTEELATIFLNKLAEWVKCGTRLAAGMAITEFVEGYELLLVANPINPQGAPTLNGRLRLIWPDANHYYPWDPDCDEACSQQTLLPERDSSASLLPPCEAC